MLSPRSKANHYWDAAPVAVYCRMMDIMWLWNFAGRPGGIWGSQAVKAVQQHFNMILVITCPCDRTHTLELSLINLYLHTHCACVLLRSDTYFQALTTTGHQISGKLFMHAINTDTLGTSNSHANRNVSENCCGNKTHLYTNRLTYQKENNTNSYIGKDNAHPDFIGQWVQKGKDSWFGFLWLFDHDGDSQRHEGFGEIYHLFANKSDRQWSNCYICFLIKRQRQNESVWQSDPFMYLCKLLKRGERCTRHFFYLVWWQSHCLWGHPCWA